MSTPRLFKFRVWHPTAGKMFYSSDDDPFFFGHEAPDGGDCLINTGGQWDNLHRSKNGRVFNRDPNQVCEQWTGLTDLVGKDIFEGDVVEWSHPMTDVGEVVYAMNTIRSPNQCFFGVKTKRLGICHFQFDDTYLVVGNIHRNTSY